MLKKTLALVVLLASTPALAEAPEPAPAEPAPTPTVRTGGDLTVHDPPREMAPRDFPPRMRTHIEGALSAGSARVWVGFPVPAYVPLTVGVSELFILDPVRGVGHLAFYRQPYDAGQGEGCSLGGAANCLYRARLYREDGSLAWDLDLNALLSRDDQLEIQDIQLHGDTLYFNEACQSYSSGAKGKCSALVAVDVSGETPKVRWRTKPLVSNGTFMTLDRYIIAGYGFTAETDYVRIVDRKSGKVRQKLWVKTAPETYSIEEGGDVLFVGLYGGGPPMQFRMRGFDGKRPSLKRVKANKAKGGRR